MASGQRFGGYPAEFGYATGQTMALAHLEANELTMNNMVGVQHPPGSIDPAAFLMSRTKPVFRLRTPDLATLFGVIGFQSGKCFDEPSTFYLQERADCGTFEAGSTHIGRRTQKGFMHLDGISAELESEDGAMASLIYTPMAVTGFDIVQNQVAVALPGTSPAFVSAYFLGPIYVNNTLLPGVMSQTWSPQIRFQTTPSSPGYADTHGSIIQRDAQFSFRALKTDEFDNWCNTGKNITTAWDFYMHKADTTNANCDGRIAFNSAVHAKASFQSGRVEVQSLSYDGVEDAAAEVVVTPSGSVTFSIAAAIPAVFP